MTVKEMILRHFARHASEVHNVNITCAGKRTENGEFHQLVEEDYIVDGLRRRKFFMMPMPSRSM